MSKRSPTSSAASGIHSYRMHVSQKYLDLTKKKLELTRLPREPQSAHHMLDFGVSKSDLEPLIDHWMEEYDWRKEEAALNDSLPQFRAVINGTRLHFVHRKSQSPTAIPLLFVHGFPESFLTVSPMIDALCAPISTPPRGDDGVPAFHVVAPSLPGFGFSDPLPEEGNAVPTTAAVLDALMKSLGYTQYMVHGSGWAFKICRMLALGHNDSCMAIHTVNPEVPPPRSSFGYMEGDMASPMSMHSPGITPPLTPGVAPQPTDRPQTAAYALCDSPPGLLAYMLDQIQPAGFRASRSPQSLAPSSASSSSGRPSPVLSRSPSSPAGSVTTPGPAPGRSPQHQPGLSPQTSPLELTDIRNPWTPTALITWTMIYWLPGPEVALRWLTNSAALAPSLWLSHSNVPLGITHFRDARSPSSGTGQTPPQWSVAYHRVAMLRRHEGRVRFPAWERPAEVVTDIRELAGILGAVPEHSPGPTGMAVPMPPPPVPPGSR